MIATVERIKQQIRSLASDEAEELLRDLQHEYPNPARSDDKAEAAAASFGLGLHLRSESVTVRWGGQKITLDQKTSDDIESKVSQAQCA
ncbi:MAG: hypothetical protein QE570_12340 [Verrucomicrobiota bacterium]|jgi:hypothetical protein|nr:hypothetical protein [Verrucomicrobiota bacterium]